MALRATKGGEDAVAARRRFRWFLNRAEGHLTCLKPFFPRSPEWLPHVPPQSAF
jgi:hypothetical protein